MATTESKSETHVEYAELARQHPDLFMVRCGCLAGCERCLRKQERPRALTELLELAQAYDLVWLMLWPDIDGLKGVDANTSGTVRRGRTYEEALAQHILIAVRRAEREEGDGVR